jgi:hypothetical protein
MDLEHPSRRRPRPLDPSLARPHRFHRTMKREASQAEEMME